MPSLGLSSAFQAGMEHALIGAVCMLQLTPHHTLLAGAQPPPHRSHARACNTLQACSLLRLCTQEQPSARAEKARDVYSRAFKSIRDSQPDAKEEAQMVLEVWKEFEDSQDWR